MAKQGIVKGYEDGAFKGNKEISRAELAIMLTRAMGYTNDQPYHHSFKDFDTKAWYAAELTNALNHVVTKGYTDGTYRPNMIIPREQAAVMIANILRKSIDDSNIQASVYTDRDSVVNWAKHDVDFVTDKAIMKGNEKGQFLPKKTLTRSEAAVMIYNLLQISEIR